MRSYYYYYYKKKIKIFLLMICYASTGEKIIFQTNLASKLIKNKILFLCKIFDSNADYLTVKIKM